jgi:23S rRNA (guanosine2251-2'-O)-methyltransferase
MEAVYGIHPIKILLARKEVHLKKIFVAVGRGGSSISEILDHARRKNIPVEWKERDVLDAMAGTKQHQGVVGMQPSFVYAELDDLLKNRNPHVSHGLIVMLDGIQDPQNLGAIIRSAHGLGANGVVIPTNRAASVTPAVMKASAGSAGELPIARVTNVALAMDAFKKEGFWIFGADAYEGQNIREQSFDVPVVLVLGGEYKGIRPLVKKKCDVLVRIPMAGYCDSLNVAVAAGIIQYEILSKQMRHDAGKDLEKPPKIKIGACNLTY